jgi:Spy/CpxP family protein refolding chaperone
MALRGRWGWLITAAGVPTRPKHRNGELHMKLIRLTTLLAACLFAMAALAQQNPPTQESGDHKHGEHMAPGMGNVDDHVKELTTKLNLTADQQTKVKTILDEHHQQMKATMNDQSMSKEDKHAKMKSMHDTVHAKMREVLTDDQKPKFDAMVKDMESNMHSHGDKDHDKDHK